MEGIRDKIRKTTPGNIPAPPREVSQKNNGMLCGYAPEQPRERTVSHDRNQRGSPKGKQLGDSYGFEQWLNSAEEKRTTGFFSAGGSVCLFVFQFPHQQHSKPNALPKRQPLMVCADVADQVEYRIAVSEAERGNVV